MRSAALLALAASFSATTATVLQGFNYGSTQTDGSAKTQSVFESEFSAAKTLAGTNGGFTSARLYTMIQAGTTADPISAIPAAIAQGTSLLLGMWASSGQTTIDNEIKALQSAIKTYGDKFTSIVTGLSVGSEDLYRITPTGIENGSNPGASPDTLVSYIKQLRSALQGTTLSKVSIGHVDTWTAWVNGSNAEVINNVDWLGVDAYPYFQSSEANGIANGESLFFTAYNNTVGVANNKPVWITETGWPVSGKTENAAVPSLANAKTYWEQVGCLKAFGKINTYWFTLQDAYPTTPNPSFGIVGTTLSNTPLYDLSCAGVTSDSSLAVSTSGSSSSASESISISGSSSTYAAAASATGGSGLTPSEGNGNGVGASSNGISASGSGTASATASASGAGSSGSSTTTGSAGSKSSTTASGNSAATLHSGQFLGGALGAVFAVAALL